MAERHLPDGVAKQRVDSDEKGAKPEGTETFAHYPPYPLSLLPSALTCQDSRGEVVTGRRLINGKNVLLAFVAASVS